MTSQHEDTPQPMAKQALALYDEQGEDALIIGLGQMAHPAQTHETWRNAGVCVLDDGTAVLQQQDVYEFRWTNNVGQQVAARRAAEFPQEKRRFRWFDHSPLQSWPNGNSIWQDVDELLTQRALDMLAEQDIRPDWADGDPSEMPAVNILRECPQLGALIDAAAQQEPKLPDWMANTISDHIREMAYSVIENLHEDDLSKAVSTIAHHLSAESENQQMA